MDVPNSTGESSIAIANNFSSTGTSTYSVFFPTLASVRGRAEKEFNSWFFRNWDEMMKNIKKGEQKRWLCEHYNRSCRVRFPCCTQFYPCHRCHNSASNCKNDEVKECHATHLKCSLCQFEQEVGFRFPWLRVHVTVGSLRNDHGNGGDSASIESYDWLNQEK